MSEISKSQYIEDEIKEIAEKLELKVVELQVWVTGSGMIQIHAKLEE